MTLMSLEDVLPVPLQIFVALCVGLAFGSFATMLLYRMPKGESIGGRSRCPQCSHMLAWYDLLPLVSYLMLLGKCRYCRAPISPRYPLTEAFSALLFVFVTFHFRTIPLLPLSALTAALYTGFLIALYDLKTQRMPDVLLLLFFLFAALYRMNVLPDGWSFLYDAILATGIPLFFFGGLWIVSRGRWIGSGDIFLGGSLGLLLGFTGSIVMLFLTYFLGAAVAAILLLLKKVDRNTRIAFGPFLCLGAFLSLVFGDRLIELYVRLLVGP